MHLKYQKILNVIYRIIKLDIPLSIATNTNDVRRFLYVHTYARTICTFRQSRL